MTDSGLPSPQTTEGGWALVGEISAPFGIRGEVKMVPLLDDPTLLVRLPDVRMRLASGREETRRIVSLRWHQGVALVAFESVADRNVVESWRGAQIFIRQSELPPLEEGAFYDWQLMGLQVVTESGRDLGKIERVHFYPANDVYETAVALIPAVQDIVVETNIAEGRMVVRDIPGLRKDEL